MYSPVFDTLKSVFGPDPSGRKEDKGVSVGGAWVTQGPCPLPVGSGT